jgi:hypothetical protein
LSIPENMTPRIPAIMTGRTKRLNYDGRTSEKPLRTYPNGGGAREVHAIEIRRSKVRGQPY